MRQEVEKYLEKSNAQKKSSQDRQQQAYRERVIMAAGLLQQEEINREEFYDAPTKRGKYYIETDDNGIDRYYVEKPIPIELTEEEFKAVEGTFSEQELEGFRNEGKPREDTYKPSSNGYIWLYVAAVIWFIVAIVLSTTAEKKLDRETSRLMGVDSVANFQGTIYTVGAFLAGILNAVGGTIAKTIDRK